MQFTIIFRHRKENLKKCSLQPLIERQDFRFYSYPLKETIELPPNTFLLSFDGPPLTEADKEASIIVLDATWKLATHMEKGLAPLIGDLPRRSLPTTIRTAYPRRQTACADPDRGLASIEAIYLAYLAMGKSTEGLLEHYHWKEPFLDSIKNH